MSTRVVMTVALVVALAMPAYVRAHEGHSHKVMGTVAARHEHHLEVKTTGGKSTTITLNEKTKILRGRTKVGVEDIKAGERVVVTATQTKAKDGKPTMIASEVRLAERGSRSLER